MIGKVILYIVGVFLLIGVVRIVFAFIQGGGLYTREGLFWAFLFVILGAFWCGYLTGKKENPN